MKRLTGVLIPIVLLIILWSCDQLPEVTQVSSDMPCVGPSKITFGEISDDYVEVITSIQPLAEYLVERLSDSGYLCGNVTASVKVVNTVDEMIGLINNDEVDIFMDSMYPAMLVSDATGAQPILRRWRNCDAEYYSVIFTTSESDISSIEDLPGHMITMDRSYSTSGFIFPAIYLMEQGLKLVVKETFTETVAGDEVGIVFSLDDINTLDYVLDGKVSAGATDDWYFDNWQTEVPGYYEITLVKLGETQSVPRQAVLVRSSLEDSLREAIKDELLNAHLNQEGISILEAAAGTCMFEDSLDGILAAFEQIRDMHDKITEIPGWQKAHDEGH